MNALAEDRTNDVNAAWIRERLVFPRAILSLLKDTNVFGELLDQALDDLDAVLERLPQDAR